MPLDPTSILDSTKKVLQVQFDYDVFDADIILHINSVLATLHQLGIGPVEGFQITGDQEKWDAFLGNDPRLNMVKSYVYLRVRLLFDPPMNSFLLTSMKEQVQEYEWRMNVYREGVVWVTPVDPIVSGAGGVVDGGEG